MRKTSFFRTEPQQQNNEQTKQQEKGCSAENKHDSGDIIPIAFYNATTHRANKQYNEDDIKNQYDYLLCSRLTILCICK
jgi:hypothetical protein